MALIKPERPQLIFFRVCLAGALTAITFLAITALQFPAAGNVSDKLNHLLAFLVLAGLTDRSFPETEFGLLKALPLMGYGILIEYIQYLIPFREFSLLDMAADGAGLIIYRAAVAVFNQLRIANDE
ncbi:MAG: VanZ family protein [Desulfosalsimonadaceae bacterium]